MKNTKQKILDTSKKLFNEFGYSRVTIRMIASASNLSSGNLNYHFRKREDILEVLYFEMVEVFDRRIEILEDQNISLALMKKDIQNSMKRMVEYRFFWTDLFYLLKQNNSINSHFYKVKQERVNGFKYVLDILIKQNVLKKPSFNNEYNHLIDRMISYSNTWLYASELYDGNKNNTDIIKSASFNLLSMLYPYLTGTGQAEFKSIHPSYFKS